MYIANSAHLPSARPTAQVIWCLAAGCGDLVNNASHRVISWRQWKVFGKPLLMWPIKFCSMLSAIRMLFESGTEWKRFPRFAICLLSSNYQSISRWCCRIFLVWVTAWIRKQFSGNRLSDWLAGCYCKEFRKVLFFICFWSYQPLTPILLLEQHGVQLPFK